MSIDPVELYGKILMNASYLKPLELTYLRKLLIEKEPTKNK